MHQDRERGCAILSQFFCAFVCSRHCAMLGAQPALHAAPLQTRPRRGPHCRAPPTAGTPPQCCLPIPATEARGRPLEALRPQQQLDPSYRPLHPAATTCSGDQRQQHVHMAQRRARATPLELLQVGLQLPAARAPLSAKPASSPAQAPAALSALHLAPARAPAGLSPRSHAQEWSQQLDANEEQLKSVKATILRRQASRKQRRPALAALQVPGESEEGSPAATRAAADSREDAGQVNALWRALLSRCGCLCVLLPT